MQALQSMVSGLSQPANLSLVLATVWAINNYYARKAAPVTIAQYAISSRSRWQQRDLIESILLTSQKHQARYGGDKVLFLIEDNYGDAENVGSDWSYGNQVAKENGVWIADSLVALNRLEEDLLNPSKNYNRNGYFCIIYTGGLPYIETKFHMQKLFLRFFRLHVTNVNFFLVRDDTVELYTFFPFTKRYCYDTNLQLYISFHDIRADTQFVSRKPLFPNKVRNMHGCMVSVTTWTDPPFNFVDKDPQTGEFIRLRGIEGLLISMLAQQMNFTIRLVESSVPTNGFFYPNGTVTGGSKLIVDGETNITMGAYMLSKERADHMLPSRSYMSVPEVFIIPHGYPLSPFERLTKPFGVVIWACVTSTILCGILVIFGLKLMARRSVRIFVFGYDNRTPLTSLLGTLLGGAVQNKLPRRNFSRYLLALWLLYTMVIRTAYMGELYIMLHDGRGRTSIRTITEAAENENTLYTTPVIAIILNNTFGATRITIIDNLERDYPKLLKLMATTQDKVAMTIAEPSAKYYNQQQHDPSKRVNILTEHVVMMPIAMYMQKHSYLKDHIDKLLLDMMAAGLVNYFEELYVNKTFDPQNSDQQPTVISLQLLFGLFSVYFVLLLFCLVIFLLELLSAKFPKLRKVLDFCNY